MIGWALTIGFIAIGIAMLMNLWRLAKGPDLTDRILTLDTLVINVIALVTLLGIAWSSVLAFEAALLFAMVGFVSTVAFCKFLLRGDVID